MKHTNDHWVRGEQLRTMMAAISARQKLPRGGGEIFHQTADEEGADPHTAFNLGGIYNINQNHHILFSCGRDIEGDTHFRPYIAYQFTFQAARGWTSFGRAAFHFLTDPDGRS